MEERIKIINDAFDLLRFKGVIKTQRDFAKLIGMGSANLCRALKGDPKYLTGNTIAKVTYAVKMYSEADKGISINQSPNTNVATNGSYIIEGRRDVIDIPERSDNPLVPIIPYKLYNESGVNILEYIHDMTKKDVQRTPAITQFSSTTCYYFVNTGAMSPNFFPGDLLALKSIPITAPIVNGEIYAIGTNDLGIILRYAYDKGDHIEMRSSVERFESFNLPKDQINNIFRIIGLIRTNI